MKGCPSSSSRTLMDLFKQPAAKRLKRHSSPPLSPSSSSSKDASSLSASTLTSEERLKMEFNKALAKSKRNLKRCSDVVSKSTSKGYNDPYHGPGQAMGLSFSVPNGVKVPSSLVNIYKELQQDLGCSIPSSGNLEKWAVQGVLLLNAVLTVRQYQANSHAKKGWELFTDAVIETISQKKRGVIFLLWGNYAQAKARLVDETKHHVLKAVHPSGLSANRGFFGCRHFSRTNQLLEKMGTSPIDWQL
ncbi:uracil-DNA glycosylase, mitochondrial [Olea europaea var. sylvestris]|uniref:uracil-DNA glycosylase, mitochondrial n=1 Tax=Olea europaea var. sylvestris TaxID=158386 RepID=UPI000C1CE67C|nr:uracil-DNA glycosylase, mitochondrial [Olea europaea var. sylvestris]